jgi:hypothetical protein
MKQRTFARLSCVVLALLLVAPTAYAQGLQTGTITGLVTSQDAASLPGVTVTASSPALQETREAVSDVNGIYYLRALPPGTYTVQFTLAGFQSALREEVVVSLGGAVDIDATLPVATQSELVTVTAKAPSVLATTATGRNVAKAAIDALPVGRRPVDVAELTPGLTANT